MIDTNVCNVFLLCAYCERGGMVFWSFFRKKREGNKPSLGKNKWKTQLLFHKVVPKFGIVRIIIIDEINRTIDNLIVVALF